MRNKSSPFKLYLLNFIKIYIQITIIQGVSEIRVLILTRERTR
jgi:hypothetical protein